MRTLAAVVAAGAALSALLSGCTQESTRASAATPTACAGAPVLAWSSQDASPSRFSAVTTDPPTDVATVAVKGITPAAVNTSKVGERAYFLSTGDVQHDRTHLVTWDATRCRADAVELKDVPMPLALATDGTRFLTTNTINGASIIRSLDADGKERARGQLPGVVVTELLLDAVTVYGLGMELHPEGSDTYVLLALDATTLTERSRRPLPEAASQVTSALIHDGKLIYPLTYSEASKAPGHALAVLDLTTNRATTIDLGADLPYLLRASGQTLYVGHTFMNPAFGAISGLRHLSRVDLATGAVTGADLEAGIVDFDVDAARVYLLGQAGADTDAYVVETYDAAALTRTASVTVTRPTRGGYYYPAGILAP